MSPVIPVTPTLLSDVSENVSELSYVMAPPENPPSDTKSKPQLRSNRHFHSNALKRSPLTPRYGIILCEVILCYFYVYFVQFILGKKCALYCQHSY